MLEIKAFVRVNMVDKVVQALETAGITNITVIDVRAIWSGSHERTREMKYSIELAERYMNVAKPRPGAGRGRRPRDRADPRRRADRPTRRRDDLRVARRERRPRPHGPPQRRCAVDVGDAR